MNVPPHFGQRALLRSLKKELKRERRKNKRSRIRQQKLAKKENKSMALIDITKKIRVEIPHELQEWVELRRLTGSELDEARDNEMVKTVLKYSPVLSQLTAISDSKESKQKLKEEITEESEEISYKKLKEEYDFYTLAEYGVIGWSYPDAINAENFMRLDSETRDWLHVELLKLNVRIPQVKKD